MCCLKHSCLDKFDLDGLYRILSLSLERSTSLSKNSLVVRGNDANYQMLLKETTRATLPQGVVYKCVCSVAVQDQ